MIPNRWLAPAFAALLLIGCDRAAAPVPSGEAEGREAAQAAPPARHSPPAAAPAARTAPAADPAIGSVLLARETIAVAGEPACALTVRYGDGEEQPVTWRGEGCADIRIRLVSIEDLRGIGQDSKLEEETRDDLARLPAGRALYVEGGHSSALYPANVAKLVYEVPLAD